MPDDADVLASWADDPIFSAHAGWTYRPRSDDSLREWREWIVSMDPQLVRLAALDGSTIIGYVDLHGAGSVRELGYVIGPSRRWGHGLGTMAARAGLDHGFGVLDLDSIWAEAVEANVASRRVLEKLGMSDLGPGANEMFLGQRSRYRRYRITRSEWLARRVSR